MPEPRHRAAHAPCLGLLGTDHADIDRTLLPDAVAGEQVFVFIDLGWEVGAELLEEIEHRTFAPLVQTLEVVALVPAGFLVLRHAVRKIAVDPTRAVVGGMHARTGNRL